MGNAVSDVVLGEISSRKKMVDAMNRYVHVSYYRFRVFYRTKIVARAPRMRVCELTFWTSAYLHRNSLSALRDAISCVKGNVFANDSHTKRKQAELMLGYFTDPLRSSKYPNCKDLTPTEYGKKLHADRVCNMTMLKELEHEIKVCKDRITRADREWEEDNAKWAEREAAGVGGAEASSSSSSATSSLIDGQIQYVREQLRKGKISKKEADKKIAKYEQMARTLNKKD